MRAFLVFRNCENHKQCRLKVYLIISLFLWFSVPGVQSLTSKELKVSFDRSVRRQFPMS